MQRLKDCSRRSLLVVAIAAIATLIFPAAAVAEGDRGLVFLVDPERFADDAALRRAILESPAQLATTQVETLKSGEALPQLVARVYGYGVTSTSQRYKDIQQDLVQSIVKVNDIRDLNKIPAGAQLRLPQFLKRPLTKGGVSTLAQVLDLAPSTNTGTWPTSGSAPPMGYTVANQDGTALWSKRAATVNTNQMASSMQRIAEKALLKVSLEQVQRAGGLSALQQRVRNGTLSLPPNTDTYEVAFAHGNESALLPMLDAVPTSTLPSHRGFKNFSFSADQIEAIRAKKGTLVLLDTFSKDNSPECAHGDLVREKAIQTLRVLGLESEIGRIKTQSVDFYENRSANIEFIRSWMLRSFRPPALDTYKLALNELERAKPPSASRPGVVPVPGLYLQAIYGTLSEDDSALVISGSFFTTAPDNIFPKDIVLNPRANFVNAVLNDRVALEARPQATTEPLQTFNRYREVLGTVLVGYFDESGTAQGMYSDNGLGVTSIDDGLVVGREGKCRGKTDRGASYAAPVVAVKLLVGRLLWRTQDNYVDAILARQRLLRSASVRKEYLGKYWSAGPASPERLYAPAGHYMVSPDGTRTDAKKLAGRLTLTVEVELTNGLKRIPYLFDPEEKDLSPGFSALVFEKDSAFLLERSKSGAASWLSTKPVGLCFCVDDEKVLSIPEVLTTLKEITKND